MKKQGLTTASIHSYSLSDEERPNEEDAVGRGRLVVLVALLSLSSLESAALERVTLLMGSENMSRFGFKLQKKYNGVINVPGLVCKDFFRGLVPPGEGSTACGLPNMPHKETAKEMAAAASKIRRVGSFRAFHAS